MNLFRSEEHARNWKQFKPEMESQLRPVSAWIERFSGEIFRARIRPDFISWWTEWRARQQQGR